DILEHLNVDLDYLRRKVEILSPANPETESAHEKKNLHLTRQAERTLKTTCLEAKLFNNSSINTAHIQLSIMSNQNDPTTKNLNRLHFDYDEVKGEFNTMTTPEDNDDMIDPPSADTSYSDGGPKEESPRRNPCKTGGGSSKSGNKSNKKSKTPVLDNFGR